MFKYEQTSKAGPVYITHDNRYIGTLYTRKFGQPITPYVELGMSVTLSIEELVELAKFCEKIVSEIEVNLTNEKV